MNTEAAYLVKALRGFVLNEHPGPFEGDWGELMHLADIHAVTGILGYTVMSRPDLFDREILGFMRRKCMQSIAVYSQRAEAMKQLIHKLNEQQIDHLLFKGFILRDYYAIPELRSFGDIDFLIHPEDRQRTDELMMAEGYARKTDWEPVFSYYRNAEFYEIHTDVMEVDVSDQADYKGYFQHIWKHAHLVGKHSWELSPEFHFLYLLTHIAKHISGSGAGIRMYMDIAVFIRHFGDSIDWEQIRRELSVLHFTDFANMVLTVTQQYFGVKSPLPLRCVDDQVLEDFVSYTMAGGTFGHVGRDPGLVALKTQDRNEATVSRWRTFLNRLFPSASSIESRYTYLQNRHWLLPVAWVHRFFRKRDLWGYHAKEARSIMNTDTEEVLKLKRIYKEIGL